MGLLGVGAGRAPASGGWGGAPTPRYAGTWNGTTEQLRAISFKVSRKDRIVAVTAQFHITGEVDGEQCGFTETSTRRFKPPIPIAKGTFTATWDGHTVRGEFSSKDLARGTLKVIATDPEGCSGRVETTWEARKGAPPAGKYEGARSGTVSYPLPNGVVFEDEVGFEVEGDGVTSFTLLLIVVGSNCVGIGPTVTFIFDDDPIPIEDDRFTIEGEGQISFTIHGAFDSETSASGDLTISGTLGTCTGTSNGTWEATRQEG